ncbi:hypothetical protein HG531_003395 [Fusarium graminearum]|nr:hypothetical protein HG531_003395 [Fusarium graminearum]
MCQEKIKIDTSESQEVEDQGIDNLEGERVFLLEKGLDEDVGGTSTLGTVRCLLSSDIAKSLQSSGRVKNGNRDSDQGSRNNMSLSECACSAANEGEQESLEESSRLVKSLLERVEQVNIELLGFLKLFLVGGSQVVLTSLLRRLVGSNLLQNQICKVDAVALLLSGGLEIPTVLEQIVILLVGHELSVHVKVIGINLNLFNNLVILAPSLVVVVDLVLILSLVAKSRIVTEVVDSGLSSDRLASILLLSQLATYAQDCSRGAVVNKVFRLIIVAF